MFRGLRCITNSAARKTVDSPARARLLTRAQAEWMFGLCLLLNSPLKVFQGCDRISIQVKHRLAILELCGLGIEYLGQHLERHPNIVNFCHAAARVYGVKS